MTVILFVLEQKEEMKTSENVEFNKAMVLNHIEKLDMKPVFENSNKIMNYYSEVTE